MYSHIHYVNSLNEYPIATWLLFESHFKSFAYSQLWKNEFFNHCFWGILTKRKYWRYSTESIYLPSWGTLNNWENFLCYNFYQRQIDLYASFKYLRNHGLEWTIKVSILYLSSGLSRLVYRRWYRNRWCSYRLITAKRVASIFIIAWKLGAWWRSLKMLNCSLSGWGWGMWDGRIVWRRVMYGILMRMR